MESGLLTREWIEATPVGVSRVNQNEFLVTVGKQVWSGEVRNRERLEATLRVKRAKDGQAGLKDDGNW